MTDTQTIAGRSDELLWGPFAEAAKHAHPATRDFRSVAETLVPILVDRAIGANAALVAAHAAKLKGRILYVGTERELIPTALRAGASELTLLDPYRLDEATLDAALANPGDRYRLIVLPSFVYAAWSTQEAASVLAAKIVALLDQGGLLIVDESDDMFAAKEAPVHEAEFVVDGNRLPGCIGWNAACQPGAMVMNASYETAVGNPASMRVEALRLERHLAAALPKLLVERGLIVVDHSPMPASSGESRLAMFKAKAVAPLCHPFGPLTLSGTPGKVLTLVEGKGCKVRDAAGKEYIDAGGGLWNTHIGLGNPEVIAAITGQLERLSYATLFAERGNEPAAELARELIAIAPYPMQWVSFTGSGSESTDLAMRLAVLYHLILGRKDRKKVAYLSESYHGTFAASASVSGLMPLKDVFQSNPNAIAIPTPNLSKCPADQSAAEFALNCANALEEKAKAGDVAAFIVEPMLGSAGVIIPPREYFDRIQEICRRHDILLIVDEVATGFGRTGRWFASEHYGLRPDLLLLAKGINSGYLPLGAVLFSAEIGEKFIKSGLPLVHGSTYNGHPVSCASALANLRVLKRDRLVERSDEVGRHFKQQLETLLTTSCVREVRGIGLMLAVELRQVDGAAVTPPQLQEIVKRLQSQGLLVYPSASALTLCPSLIISPEEIEVVVATLQTVLAAAHLEGGAIHWKEAAADLA